MNQGVVSLLSLLMCSTFPLVSHNVLVLLVTSQCQASVLKLWLLPSQEKTEHLRVGDAALLPIY